MEAFELVPLYGHVFPRFFGGQDGALAHQLRGSLSSHSATHSKPVPPTAPWAMAASTVIRGVFSPMQMATLILLATTTPSPTQEQPLLLAFLPADYHLHLTTTLFLFMLSSSFSQHLSVTSPYQFYPYLTCRWKCRLSCT